MPLQSLPPEHYIPAFAFMGGLWTTSIGIATKIAVELWKRNQTLSNAAIENSKLSAVALNTVSNSLDSNTQALRELRDGNATAVREIREAIREARVDTYRMEPPPWWNNPPRSGGERSG